MNQDQERQCFPILSISCSMQTVKMVWLMFGLSFCELFVMWLWASMRKLHDLAWIAAPRHLLRKSNSFSWSDRLQCAENGNDHKVKRRSTTPHDNCHCERNFASPCCHSKHQWKDRIFPDVVSRHLQRDRKSDGQAVTSSKGNLTF